MKSQEYIIRYRGQFPVQVVKNVAGRVFSLVSEDRASRFGNQREGQLAARDHGITAGEFTVEPLNQPVKGFINLVCPHCKKVHAPFCRQ